MYCLKYYPFHDDIYSNVDEIKITFNPSDDTLPKFLDKWANKTIVIDVSTYNLVDYIDFFKELNTQHPHFKLLVNYYNFIENWDIFKVNFNIPYFFNVYAASIDRVYGLMQYKPVNIYIVEELAFCLGRVSKMLHANGIAVRVIPNICESSVKELPPLKKFFIRPDDIVYYEDVVDIFELFTDEARAKTVLKIYKQGKWLGKLNDIIPSFKEDLDNRFILNSFGKARVDCGKRCMYKPGSCNICDRCADYSRMVIEKSKIKEEN